MSAAPGLLPATPNSRLRRLLLRFAGIVGAELASHGVRILVVAWPLDASTYLLLVAELARNAVPLAAGVALALDLFECGLAHRRLPLRWLALAIAVIAVVASTSALVSGDTALRLGLIESGRSLALHTLWNNLIVALLAVAYLTRRRDSSEAAERRRAQTVRLAQARHRLDTVSAQATQSRLDPEMLFDCLSRARRVYPGDLDAGDALLARLTTYLRLTLSIGSSELDTPDREALLAAARVDVERRDPPHPEPEIAHAR